MWSINVWPPNKSGPPRIVTNLDALKGIDDGFAWTLSPHGGCVKLVLRAMNSRLRLGPLDIVQLSIGGTPWYYGTVPEPSHIEQPDVEEQVVLGGREILGRALMDGKVYRSAGVYAIVRDVLTRLAPPGVTVIAALIGDGTGTDAGPTLDTFYSPTATLLDALTALAKSAGCIWDVDVQGRVFFRPANTTPLTVPYAGQRWQRLRVQGADACTQAALRIITAPGEGALTAGTLIDESFGVPYLPATVSAVATAPEHSLYGYSRSISAPEGVSLTRNSYAGELSFNEMDGTPAMDGDPDTGTTTTGPRPGITIRNTTERVIGLRLRYRYMPTEGLIGAVAIQHAFVDPALGASVGSDVMFGLPESASTREMVFVAPPAAEVVSAGWNISQAQVYVITPTEAGTAPVALTIYDMALLVVDEDAAQRVAASFLQPPYYQPTEVELAGLVPPRPLLTVTDSPDGTVTGETGAWEYQYTLDQYGVTLARLGSDGQDDEARAIRLAIRRGA